MNQQSINSKCVYADLGVVAVPLIEDLMEEAAELRCQDNIPDLLLFMAHPPTVALGLRDLRSENPVDLLVSAHQLAIDGVALTRSVRGGGITYHWPGQVVCYPILALKPDERDVSSYMFKLEQVGIQVLEALGVRADRRRDSGAYVGLWVGDTKVMSMGVRIRNWITSFGFALNLEGDYSYSRHVRPCGIEGACLFTVEKLLGSAPERKMVLEIVRANFASVFGKTLISAASVDASEVHRLLTRFRCRQVP